MKSNRISFPLSLTLYYDLISRKICEKCEETVSPGIIILTAKCVNTDSLAN